VFIYLAIAFAVLSLYLFYKNRKLKDDLFDIESEKEEVKRLISKVDELNVRYNEAEFENEKLFHLVEQYENVTQAASRLIEMASQFDSDTGFMKKLLEEAVEIIPEAEYGSVVIVDGDEWQYVHTVGHNLGLLQRLDLKKRYFLNPRDSEDTMYFDSNVFVLDGIEVHNSGMPEDIFREYYQATLRTNQTAIMEIDIGDDIAGTISIDTSKKSNATFSNESLKMFGALGNIAATFLAFQRLGKMHEEFQKEVILSIIRMMEIHDAYTRGHSEMVADLSKKIAIKMGYDKERVKETYWSGLVHDIGKILVPEAILNKPSRLSNNEFDIIKKHPGWGHEVLAQSRYLSLISVNVKYHHERFDGNGYPEGVSGEDIPEVSRILAVADTWDAMTRNRSYRKALDYQTAVNELIKNKGKQFDGNVVDAFIEVLQDDNRYKDIILKGS
jgi:HD-GYP domain-containing protein (c-di-GMP phosphodiesterase class II)